MNDRTTIPDFNSYSVVNIIKKCDCGGELSAKVETHFGKGESKYLFCNDCKTIEEYKCSIKLL